MKHSCREKQRAEELATPIGQAAYMFYCDWMKAYKRKAPSADTFATSRYYATFVEFAKHVKKLNIGNPSKFVEIMCQKDLSPMLWRRDQCYSMYLEWMDKSQDPLEQVKVSIETLIDIAEREEVKIFSDIFIHMGVRQISEQIRLRKLSPWFLFCSRKFSEYLKSLSKEETLELSAIINPAYWTTAPTAHIHRRTCQFLEKRLETSKNSYKTASRSKNDYKRRHQSAVIWLWAPVSNGKSN